MTDRIAASLNRLFEDKRIVFWYDAARDMRADYDAVELPDVIKLEIGNNEFGLKYRILRQEPASKFLLYHEGPKPADRDNWLLDVLLASAVFKADQTAIWLSELGLEPAFEPVVRDHAEFFRSKARVADLKKLRQPHDTPTDMRRRMLGVCVGVQGAFDTVVEALLGELANDRDDGMRLIERVGLTDFLWKQVKANYNYKSPSPGIEDFAIALFKSCYSIGLEEDAALNAEALLLFRRWKNDKSGAGNFEILSERYGHIAKDVGSVDFRKLMGIDYFEVIDREIIRNIVGALAARTASHGDVLRWVRERRQSHWFETYADIYEAITFAAEFQHELSRVNLGMTSMIEGFERYASTWFRLDQYYRKFIYHMQKSAQATLLGDLFDQVEGLYVNSFLLRVNDAWQEQINRIDKWGINGVPSQLGFYHEQVAAYRRKDQKVCVIISDALRYEVAEECLTRIRALDRFDAELSPMLSALPSYTQLGMAALLPNKALRIAEDATGLVFDGEQSTQGQVNREKILGNGRSGDRVVIYKAEEMMALRTDESKQVFRDHDVIYVYHNRIDVVGDKLATEERLPEAVEGTLEDLINLVRKLTSANATNILITADHGFIYQHRALEESDFSIAEVAGGEVCVRNRRFVLGKGLPETSGMRKFTSAQLSLTGEMEALIPNSINRLRVKGAGSRFVHGGATLQEVVIPVLRVGKGRESDIRQVDVQIVSSGRNLISSGQVAVTFYQAQPVNEKVQARVLRAGIFASNGELISDSHELMFDFRSENARERELPRKFLLSRSAEQFNNQDVFLKLEERVGKTSHYQDYVSQIFQLRRGLSTDFDF